jgi:hypothetical protein
VIGQHYVAGIVAVAEACCCTRPASVFPLGFGRQAVIPVAGQSPRRLLLECERVAEVGRVVPACAFNRPVSVPLEITWVVTHDCQVLALSDEVFTHVKTSAEGNQGWAQEMELAQDLFVAYKCADVENWVDLYLKLAYEHPVHPVTIRLAAAALALSTAAGRQEEVLKALEHVNAIPLNFEGKRQLAAVLSKARIPDQLTHFVGGRPPTHRGS